MADRTLNEVAAECRATIAAVERFGPLVEEYLRLSGVSQTRFGILTGYGVDLVRLIRKRRRFTIETVCRVLRHIEDDISAP